MAKNYNYLISIRKYVNRINNYKNNLIFVKYLIVKKNR